MATRTAEQSTPAPKAPEEVRLARRLLIASGVFVVAAIPVTLLGYAATHGWAPLHDLDESVASDLNAWAAGSPGAVTFLKIVSDVIDPWVLRAVTAVVVVLLFVRGKRRLALWAGTTVAIGSVLGFVLKLIVQRARPELPDAVAQAGGYSFPSGHALNSFLIVGVLTLLAIPAVGRVWRPVLWAGAGAIVALVGFARIGLGVHYVSDVVTGWFIAAALIAATVVAFDTWRRPRRRPAARVLAEGVPEA